MVGTLNGNTVNAFGNCRSRRRFVFDWPDQLTKQQPAHPALAEFLDPDGRGSAEWTHARREHAELRHRLGPQLPSPPTRGDQLIEPIGRRAFFGFAPSPPLDLFDLETIQ